MQRGAATGSDTVRLAPLLAALVLAAHAAGAGAAVLSVTKIVEFKYWASAIEFAEADAEVRTGHGAGTVTLGANTAAQASPKVGSTKPQAVAYFNILQGYSQANDFVAPAGGAYARTTISVGAPAPVRPGVDPRTYEQTITAAIQATVRVPDIDPATGAGGGSAVARGKVEIDGVSGTVREVITNGRSKIVNKPLQQMNFGNGAIVLDPTYFAAVNLATGERVGGLVYRDAYSSSDGGRVGIDGAGVFTLAIPDDPAGAPCARFSAETLVPFATDLTGSVELCRGQLEVSGIFDPGAGSLTDLFDLTYSLLDPGYIVEASYRFTDRLGVLSLSPQFSDTGTTEDDLVRLTLYSDLAVALSIDEPASPAIVGLGLGLLAFFSRRRRPQASGSTRIAPMATATR